MTASSSIRTGIVYERQVTDLGFGICFLVFLVAFLVIGIYSFAKGSVNNVLIFADGADKFCGGSDPDYKAFKYFYPALDTTDGTNTLRYGNCVDKCPVKGNLEV